MFSIPNAKERKDSNSKEIVDENNSQVGQMRNLPKRKTNKDKSIKQSNKNTINTEQLNKSTNNTHPNDSYKNFFPESTAIMNFNQVFNFNQPNHSLNDLLTNQQNEMNFNSIGLGRNTSAFDYSLFPRNSQFSNQSDEPQEAFFKQFDLKPNISLFSFFGDGKNELLQEEYKGKDVFNHNFTMSLNPNENQKGKKNLLELYQKIKTSQNNNKDN